jgi:hypothetical protein
LQLKKRTDESQVERDKQQAKAAAKAKAVKVKAAKAKKNVVKHIYVLYIHI